MTTLYTAGHSDLDQSEFIALLKDNGVAWVADVRSSPYSQRMPHFNRKPLAAAMKAQGIEYWFLGDKLGGKPIGEDYGTWTQGRLDPMLLSSLASTQKWSAGIEELKQAICGPARKGTVGCLMCSEKDANNCHRSLIAFELEEVVPDLSVRHLKAGHTQSQVRFQKAMFRIAEDEDHYH